jgi:phage shock protein E
MASRSLTTAAITLLAIASVGCSGAAASAPASNDPTSNDPIAVVIDAADAVALLEERDDLTVIDVRTPPEFADGHLTGAALVDVQDPGFRDQLEPLDRDAAYLVYCRTGNRSAHAVTIMRDLGFTELYDAGGLADLAGAGASVAP